MPSSSQEPLDPLPPSGSRHGLCLLAVVGLVALDLWSKSAAFEFLAEATLVRDDTGHDRYPLVGNWLGMMRNLNYGAAFGQLKGIPTALVGLRAVAIVVLGVLVFRAPRRQGLYLSALVLILAGAMGNLYDNLFHRPFDHEAGRPFGPVRDFIDVYFPGLHWHFPTFNVADSCITVGAVLLLLSGLVGGKEGEIPEREAEPDLGADPEGAET
jgi:signal peptidase II